MSYQVSINSILLAFNGTVELMLSLKSSSFHVELESKGNVWEVDKMD